MENGTAWSNSSESSDDSSSPQLSVGMRHAHKNLVQPEVQSAPPAIEISFAPRESATSTPTRLANQKEEDEDEEDPKATIAPVKQEVPNGHPRYSRSLSHISENSADGVVADRLSGDSVETTEVTSVASSVSESDDATDVPHRAEPCIVVPETHEQSCTESKEQQELPAETTTCGSAASEKPNAEPRSRPGSYTCGEKDTSPSAEASRTDSSAQSHEPSLAKMENNNLIVEKSASLSDTRPTDGSLEEALSAVTSSLDDYRGQFPELQVLEQELKLLEDVLTVSVLRFCLCGRFCMQISVFRAHFAGSGV